MSRTSRRQLRGPPRIEPETPVPNLFAAIFPELMPRTAATPNRNGDMIMLDSLRGGTRQQDEAAAALASAVQRDNTVFRRATITIPELNLREEDPVTAAVATEAARTRNWDSLRNDLFRRTMLNGTFEASYAPNQAPVYNNEGRSSYQFADPAHLRPRQAQTVQMTETFRTSSSTPSMSEDDGHPRDPAGARPQSANRRMYDYEGFGPQAMRRPQPEPPSAAVAARQAEQEAENRFFAAMTGTNYEAGRASRSARRPERPEPPLRFPPLEPLDPPYEREERGTARVPSALGMPAEQVTGVAYGNTRGLENVNFGVDFAGIETAVVRHLADGGVPGVPVPPPPPSLPSQADIERSIIELGVRLRNEMAASDTARELCGLLEQLDRRFGQGLYAPPEKQSVVRIALSGGGERSVPGVVGSTAISRGTPLLLGASRDSLVGARATHLQYLEQQSAKRAVLELGKAAAGEVLPRLIRVQDAVTE